MIYLYIALGIAFWGFIGFQLIKLVNTVFQKNK